MDPYYVAFENVYNDLVRRALGRAEWRKYGEAAAIPRGAVVPPSAFGMFVNAQDLLDRVNGLERALQRDDYDEALYALRRAGIIAADLCPSFFDNGPGRALWPQVVRLYGLLTTWRRERMWHDMEAKHYGHHNPRTKFTDCNKCFPWVSRPSGVYAVRCFFGTRLSASTSSA